MKEKILVTGATGNLGMATIQFLLKKGVAANNISALVRDKAKAEHLKSQGITLKFGDYDNYPSLLEAFDGVDKLLLISANDIPKRSKQQENAVKAAKEAGVKHILYTSFERKNETESSPIAMVAKAHIETENNIKASGIPYTIFRNNLYMDMIPVFIGEKVLETGVFFPAGDTKTAFVTRSDMAEAIANVLTSDGHKNKEYIFSNPVNTSFKEIADILSQISGKSVGYVSPEPEIFKDTLLKAGVPMEYVGISVSFAEAIKQGEFYTSKTDLQDLLGRKPTTVKEFLAQVYAL